MTLDLGAILSWELAPGTGDACPTATAWTAVSKQSTLFLCATEMDVAFQSCRRAEKLVGCADVAMSRGT